jgi:hypothetical protein
LGDRPWRLLLVSVGTTFRTDSRIEGHRGRIEEEGGWIVVHGCRIGSEMDDVGMKVAAVVTWLVPLP